MCKSLTLKIVNFGTRKLMVVLQATGKKHKIENLKNPFALGA